jgi:hypothetical protein
VKISQSAEYAVSAILDLALHAPLNKGVRSSDVAARAGVPKKFLDAILLELRRAGSCPANGDRTVGTGSRVILPVSPWVPSLR